MSASVFAITGVAQHYAWGSATAIPTMLGTRPDGRPYAELWFGAHDAGPSPAPGTGRTLAQLVRADPEGMLGEWAAQRFGGRLPYLLKVLAPQRALSIQVHPTRAQAQAGYRREQDAGIAVSSPQRNYRDSNHKPELLYALSPFQALCGFRPPERTDRLLAALDLPDLAGLRERLRGPDGLRAAFGHLLTLPDPGGLVSAITARAGRLTGAWAATGRAIAAIGADYPGDVGVALALLLNHVELQPGQAIYLAPGNVHAYLRGTGVEIMANSDNVLRCGLTGKHVDVDELCAVADFAELADPRWAPRGPAARARFEVPVEDFALCALELDAGPVPVPGPAIALCTSGRLELTGPTGVVQAAPGHAVFVPAGAVGAVAGGTGRAFLARPGRTPEAGQR